MRVDRPQPKRLLNELVAHHLRGRSVSILEAGGGSHTFLDLEALDLQGITTIDISPEQLERNSYADEKILGDLQDYRPTRVYDLVIAHNVLEHIPRADRAVETLIDACAPGGLIVVGGPVARAFSGSVTRLTPHWFHVLAYRYGMGDPDAGKPGHAPFPTHFHPMSQPHRLTPYLERRGFDRLLLFFFESNVYRRILRHRPLIGAPLMLVTALVNALTPKSYNTRHGDFCAIYRRLEDAGTAISRSERSSSTGKTE